MLCSDKDDTQQLHSPRENLLVRQDRYSVAQKYDLMSCMLMHTIRKQQEARTNSCQSLAGCSIALITSCMAATEVRAKAGVPKALVRVLR